MEITEEWLESIKDDQGLTNGQTHLLDVWKSRLHFVGYGMLPDIVGKYIESCKGWRGMPLEVRERLNRA